METKGIFIDQKLTLNTNFWVLEKHEDELILIEFNTATKMSQFLEDREVEFGEQGKSYNPVGVSMNFQLLESFKREEYDSMVERECEKGSPYDIEMSGRID